MIQNEHVSLQTKLENIKKESKILEEQVALNKLSESHQDSLIKSMLSKLESEKARQEALEV